MAPKGTFSIRVLRLLQGSFRRDSNRWTASIVTSTRPVPSRLPISSLSFIGFRYLLSFREFWPKLGCFTIFQRMNIGQTRHDSAFNDLAVHHQNVHSIRQCRLKRLHDWKYADSCNEEFLLYEKYNYEYEVILIQGVFERH